MRCDQHIGLPQRALDFLGRYEAQGPVCPTCHRSMQAVLKGDWALRRHVHAGV